MGGTTLFLLSVGAYSVLPLVYALVKEPFRYLLFYVHLASVLTLGGILGSFYDLPITDGVILLAGQVAYGGFMFATLVMMIAGRDIRLLQGVVLLAIATNLIVYAVFVDQPRGAPLAADLLTRWTPPPRSSTRRCGSSSRAGA